MRGRKLMFDQIFVKVTNPNELILYCIYEIESNPRRNKTLDSMHLTFDWNRLRQIKIRGSHFYISHGGDKIRTVFNY